MEFSGRLFEEDVNGASLQVSIIHNPIYSR